jgi:hypothetical protein
VIKASLLHKQRSWKYLVLSVAVSLLIILPANSQEVLQRTLTNMQETEQWWDNLWQDTFDPTDFSTSISMYTFSTAVRFVLAIGLIFWLFQYGQKMAESNGMPQALSTTSHFFFPVALVIIFLTNQGQYSRVLAYGLRDTINSWSDGVMNMQVAGYNVRAALGDQLVTQDAKDVITLQAQKCMQMPRPAVALPSISRPAPDLNNPLTIQQEQAYNYLECIQKLSTLAEQKKQEALTRTCVLFPGGNNACSFFLRFIDKTIASVNQVYQVEADKFTKGEIPNPLALPIGLNDFVVGTSASVAYGPILSFTQYLWTSLLELAMWLSALFAPLFVASAIIPGRQNLFVTWLVGFLTIGLAKLAYVIVIGIVAVQLSDQPTLLGSDLRFPMALGIFAPGVSLAVVAGGGFAAAMSFRSQSVAVAGAATSALSGSFATLSYSLARLADKRR